MKSTICALLAATALTAAAAQAATKPTVIGTITVCYFSSECSFATVPGMPKQPSVAQIYRDTGEHPPSSNHVPTTSGTPVDAPAFQFTNTGTVAITGATFTIKANTALNVVKDVYHIGKIAPGASYVIVPGASNDKKTHPTGGFFTYSAPGNPLDTSDSGPDDNALVFKFAGKAGTATASSVNITPGASVAPSTDGTVAAINFLGGPGNADGPCNDCVAPKVIANITVPAAESKRK
jgi:hypothetical protein